MSSGNYRPEIDGLRAIAILLVVLYHATIIVDDIPLFPGGYIGVDVFFVISGYLITRIILPEMGNSTFSFRKFYERRARRILPALFVVAGTTSISAWNLLMPEALQEYAQSLIATALFSANIFFLKLDNYTAELIAHRPLLHMWSLGIEEQFYIFFPPLLLLLHKKFSKFTAHLTTFLGLGFLLSLGLAEYASVHAPGADFYLPPTRVWELVGGCFLATLESRKKRFAQTALTPYLPSLGLAAILVFAVFCDDALPHPSLITALPVLGTMLIIRFADRRSATIQLLSSRPFVGLGLISYSLYLWHQPVFALTRVHLDRALLTREKLLLILLCLLLALLTYFLVEKTTRNRTATSSGFIWKSAAAGSLAMLCFGLTVQVYQGFPERLLASQMIREATLGRSAPDNGSLECKNFYPEKGHCQFNGVAAGGYNLFTVGDSHIRTLDAPIVKYLPELEFISTFVPLNKGNSFFSFGLDIMYEEGNKVNSVELTAYNEKRYQTLLEFDKQIVITGGRLPMYLEHQMFDNKEGGVEPGGRFYFVHQLENDEKILDLKEVKASFKASMTRLLDNGMKVVLLYPIPEVGWNVPQAIRKKLEGKSRADLQATLTDEPITTSHEIFKARSRQAYQVYDSIPDHPNLVRVYPEEIFCKQDHCQTHDAEHLFYRDDDHLSFYGASLLLEHIISQIQTRWPDLLFSGKSSLNLTAQHLQRQQQ